MNNDKGGSFTIHPDTGEVVQTPAQDEAPEKPATGANHEATEQAPADGV